MMTAADRPAEPRWATIKEAAEYTGFSDRTMRRWVHDGRLGAKRMGPRRIQVDLNELDRLRKPVTPDTDSTRTGEPE